MTLEEAREREREVAVEKLAQRRADWEAGVTAVMKVMRFTEHGAVTPRWKDEAWAAYLKGAG